MTGNNRGIAMILTLSVISVLLILALALSQRAGRMAETVIWNRDSAILSNMAESGAHIAMALLIEDGMEGDTDTRCDIWADETRVEAILQTLPFQKGELAVRIFDESARIQANALVNFPKGRSPSQVQMNIWKRFLSSQIDYRESSLDSFEKSDDFKKKDAILTFAHSMIDWLDSGDDDAVSGTAISAYGAESEFYRDLDPPYECRNGPFAFDEELTKVRGYDFFSVPPPERNPRKITGEKGEKDTTNGPDENAFGDPDEAEDEWGFDENAHIPDYVTIRGATPAGRSKFKYDGKININTARLPVLLAMFLPENREFAQWIHSAREKAEENCQTRPPGGETGEEGVSGAPDVDIRERDWHHSGPGWESLSAAEKKLIKTSSDLFRVESVATLRGRTLTAEAIVKREGGKKKKTSCKILNLSFK
ncbi:conserved hypothetical protein [Candidatus Desulfarcum epimagneticum]|uniref:Type II secretion system protein K n=1 Tax=uncultured Desulfobacteraceae bacterium TaxID=218296 RepID=A0A484HFW0_9BACT|nr:conserved hypothetical protein [uncultured Desulfobacteraceae bacterium]